MSEQKKDWALNTPMDVAEALDWVRRRMKGSGLLLMAFSPNSIAFAADPQLKPDDAVQLVAAAQLDLRKGLEKMRSQRVTRDCARRS